MDFYAGPVPPQGARRGPHYQVKEQMDRPQAAEPEAGRAISTPQSKCPRARHPKTRPRLPRLWLCNTHQHRQCAACAAMGRGVRQCCTRRHPRQPHHPATSPRPRGRARAAGARTPWGGGGHRPSGTRPSGRGHPRPPGREPTRGGGRSPHTHTHTQTHTHTHTGQEGMYAAAGRGAARSCNDRGCINPHIPQVLAQVRPPAVTQAGARQEQ